MKRLAQIPDSRLLIGLFFFALAIRLIYLAEIRGTDFFSILVGDGFVYDSWALAIRNDWIGREVFYQAPLYPYFLAAVYTFFGHDPMAVRLIQIILGSASCVLAALAGRSFFSFRVGLCAGFLLALYSPAIFFDGLIQKAGLDLFFMTLLLFLLGKIECAATPSGRASLAPFAKQVERQDRRRWPVLTGFVLGCLALTRENAIALFPLLLIWLIWRFRDRKWLLFSAGLILALAPVTVRNAWVGGEFVVTTSQFGPNFYIGNNAAADGGYRPLRWGNGSALLERRDATEIAEQSAGRRLTPREVSSFWSARAFDWIGSHPADWLLLMARKTLLVWNDRELPDSDEPFVYEDSSLTLALSGFVFSFGTIAPLALAGIAATWADRRRLAPLYLCLFGIAASTALFFVFARYRFSMVPILVLFAAAGMAEFIRLVTEKRAAGLFAYAVLIAASGVVVRWNLNPQENPRAMAYYNLAVSLEKGGAPEKAAVYYEKSLHSKPDYLQAHINLGILLANRGEVDRAIAHYQEALRIKPENPVAWNNLGNALSTRGDVGPAAGWLARAVKAEPGNAIYHSNLARVLVMQDKLTEAEAHYRLALKIQPDFPQAQNGLATVLELKKNLRKKDLGPS